MRGRHKARPGVEPLESKLAPSAMSAAPAHAAVGAHHTRHHAPRSAMLALNGQVAGTYTTNNPIPDVGTMQTLDATGTVAPLGNVSAKGTLHAPGFIARGDTEGTLTLTNARGSVTLHLTAAAPQAGFSPPASAYVFTITGGTGAYARAKGSGTASLVETPEQRPAPEPGRPTPDYIVAPMFRLTLRPGGVTA